MFKVFVAKLVSIKHHLPFQQIAIVRAIENISLAAAALLFGLGVTPGPIPHVLIQFVIEEKGKKPRDEGDVLKDLSRSLSIRTVMGVFAPRTRGELCMRPSKRNTGLDTAMVVNCGHFREFVDELLHVV